MYSNNLIELGWDVQRFWVYQIRDNMKECIEKIQEWKK
jgi:very-short-patch-repair endonuclease